MNRRRAANLLIFGVVGIVFLMSLGLMLVVARQDYQVRSYADLFRLENIPCVLVGAAVLAAIALAVLAIPLALSARRITRPDRRRERGECERCGYDLRGSIRCPECGHAE